MFYYLASNFDVSLNLFKYITFRTGGALLTSLFIYLFFGNSFINFLKKKFIQPIRKEGPETHLKKQGTPTMGGILIIGSILFSSLLWNNLNNSYVWITLFTILAFSTIGLIDDYIKIINKNAYKGLSAWFRLILQFIITGFTSYAIYRLMPNEFKTAITIPFFKNILWDLGIFYFIFTTITIVGTSNAVNLTDGIDGLASILLISSFIVFLLVSYVVGRADYSLYLYIPYIPGTGEITILIGSILGALLGFLWFNANPAKIFMGDVGSLGLGSALGIISVITKNEFLLVVCGGIFVIEAITDMIQLISLKYRKKKIFKMAPIHHALELKGWSEQTIVIRFWIISIILALIALSSFKIR